VNPDFIVGWLPVLPISEHAWRDAVDYAIGQLQQEFGQVLRVSVPSDIHTDLLFMPYLASDQERIISEALLTQKLTSLTQRTGTLVLAACGKTKRGEAVSETAVRNMLIAQGHFVVVEQLAMRVPNTESLADKAVECIGSELQRRGFIPGARDLPAVSSDRVSFDYRDVELL
jgi:hypothetical protein